jgi:hypothetical protein
MVNDPQQPASRRNQLKQIIPSPIDRDTPHTQLTTTGPITVDVKRTINVRDSGFLDDEEGQSGRDSGLASTRQTHNKQTEIVSDDVPTSNDPLSRKIRSKKKEAFLHKRKTCFSISIETTYKPNSILTIEQQRERERQRLREEEERRKKLLIKKDHQQPIPISTVPKFEQLALDLNNDESSRSNKAKTPTSNKPTPLPRLNDENEATVEPKKVIKKRSSVTVCLIINFCLFTISVLLASFSFNCY